MTVKDPSSYGATGVAATAAPTNVQVIAPATLKAGYTFDAMYDNVTFTVVVPDGGVNKGQRFIVPFTPPAVEDAVAVAVLADGETTAAPVAKGVKQKGGSGGSSIPTGIWRDSLCACCRFGPFHPHFLNSLCFKPCLIGQVMTRMKMTWLGQRTHNNHSNFNDDRLGEAVSEQWKGTFYKIVIVTISFFVIWMLTNTPEPDLDDTDDLISSMSDVYNAQSSSQQLSDVDKLKFTLHSWITTIFATYIFYLLVQLRATIRHIYSIPEESCLCWYQLGICGTNPQEGVCPGANDTVCSSGVPIGWEDICCSMWCQLCIVAQMARHTVDYDEKTAVCCNDVGVMDWDEDEAYEGVEAGVGEGSVLVV